MIDAKSALKRLQEGNQRFVNGLRSVETMMTHTKRDQLTGGQEPFAIILGCSDSRVPAEIVFDQGLGDLFVIRVAGNIVAAGPCARLTGGMDRFLPVAHNRWPGRPAARHA